MKNKNKIKFLILIFVFLFSFSSYADLEMEYFNGLDPQKHINKIFSQEEKNKLKGNTINYDDIENMIHLYNPEVQNLWNSWENNKSSSDIYDDYMEAAANLSDTADSQDSELQQGMYNAQATAMEIQADKNADDSYTNFLANYLSEKQLVLNTKIIYLNYLKSNYDTANAMENVEEAKRKQDTAKNTYDVGAGTYVDYVLSQKNVKDADSSLITSKSNEKTYKRNILTNCGKSISDDVYIKDVVFDYNTYIANLNLQVDYETAIKNNIQYEIYKRKLNNASTTEIKNQYQISIDSAPNTIYNDLESKYDAIFDAVDSEKNRNIAYKLTVDTYNQVKNEYTSGNASSKEFHTADYNMVVAQNNLAAAKYDVMIAVENYKSIVDGFSDC